MHVTDATYKHGAFSPAAKVNPIMRLLVLVLGALLLVHTDGRKARKEFDLSKLEKEWDEGDKEDEDEGWHEDTYEWKEKVSP